MAEKKDPDQNRADICYEVLFGDEGHPEEGLVWAVKRVSAQLDQMAAQLKNLKSFGWAICLLGSTLMFKEIWALITHAS